MFDIPNFLDRAKAAAGVDSDYALALKVLGHRNQAKVSSWRNEKAIPEDSEILKLCALTGDDAEHVAACIQSMRAANDDAADLWRRVANRLKGSASMVIVLVLLGIGVLEDASRPAAAATVQTASLYIMSNAIWHLIRRLALRAWHARPQSLA